MVEDSIGCAFLRRVSGFTRASKVFGDNENSSPKSAINPVTTRFCTYFKALTAKGFFVVSDQESLFGTLLLMVLKMHHQYPPI